MSAQQQTELHMKILLVDDNSEWRLLVSVWFKENEYEYEIVDSGLLAIETLQKHTFDLIIIDLYMPIMSGIKLYEYIKSKYNTKVILMSNATKTDLDHIKIKNTYLKPLGKEEFFNIIKTNLSPDENSNNGK